MTKITDTKRLGRRAFLKAGAGAAALSGLAGSEAVAAKTTDKSAKSSRWDHEADVVVVGFGGAGGCAAIEATDNGAKDAGYRWYTASYSGRADADVPTKDLPKAQKMNGEAFFACLSTGIAKRNIKVLYETPAQSLIKNDDGEIIGVVAVGPDKKTIRVKARRGVVLTSGGYEFSTTMRKAFLEGPGVEGWAFYGSPDNTGDGIEMAQAVGAGLMGAGKVNGRLIAGVPLRSNGLKHGVVTDTAGSPNTILVDNSGDRYMDELMVATGNSRYFSY